MLLSTNLNRRILFLLACCALVCGLVLGLAGPAWATIEQDQTSLTDEQVDNALQNGSEGTSTAADQTSSDDQITTMSSSTGVTTTNSNISTGITVEAYSGATMYETAAAEARKAYPNGSRTAIIVGSGDAWMDALSVVGLSASKGPILFTNQDYLNESTKAALQELGVDSVIVVGGTAAVSDQVATDLNNAGISLEKRIWGQNAYDTQLAIYNYGLENGYWSKDKVIVATGTWYADALSVAPVAYAEKIPIFLVDSSAELNGDQKDALIASGTRGYGQNAIIVGGDAVVSEETDGFADYISALAKGSGNSMRLAGENQYETSSAIANWATSSEGFTWDNVAFATGNSPYDALAGSVCQGVSKSVLLLADDYSSSTISTAASHSGSIGNVRFFGGEAAVSMRTRMGVADAMGFPYAAIPAFKVYVDAGHGWNNTNNGDWDSGATGSGYQEADLNAELADTVGGILRDRYGMDVYINDDGGWYKLRHAEAIELGCDALVSIHFNSGSGSGTESLIHEYNASYLSSSWQDQIHPHLIDALGLRNRGEKTQEVAILSGYLPATLLEICFIDNEDDMSTYEANKDDVAEAIAEGIVS